MNKSAIVTGLIGLFTLSVPLCMLNITPVLVGEGLHWYHALASILFACMIILIAALVSNKTNRSLFAFSCYWGIGALLTLVGYYGELLMVSIPSVLFFATPLYGLNMWLNMKPDISLVLLLITIAYLLSVIGWAIGTYVRLNIKQIAFHNETDENEK